MFHPDAGGMYAPGASVTVDESLLAGGLCGRSRPGHFRGVCTVVAMLFNLVRPDFAVFGRKDYQQLAIIRRMVRDLHFPLEILPAETSREPDGLARSSRNVYLSAQERAQAPVLRRALLRAQRHAADGERDADRLRAVLETELATASLARVDYAEVVDAVDLQPVRTVEKPTLLALAVFFGRTRLIDNILLEPRRTRPPGRLIFSPCKATTSSSSAAAWPD